MDDSNEEGTPLWLKILYWVVPTFGASGLLYLFRFFMKGDLYDKKTKIGGKIVIITGIDSEVSKATAIDLAKREGKINIACQDTAKGEEALKEIKKKSGKDNVNLLELNLESLDLIREFSRKFHELENKLDILISNHEVFMCAKSKTAYGSESFRSIFVDQLVIGSFEEITKQNHIRKQYSLQIWFN